MRHQMLRWQWLHLVTKNVVDAGTTEMMSVMMHPTPNCADAALPIYLAPVNSDK
jgi:hypothetical protein